MSNPAETHSGTVLDECGLRLKCTLPAGVQPIPAHQQEALCGAAMDQSREMGQDGHQGGALILVEHAGVPALGSHAWMEHKP